MSREVRALRARIDRLEPKLSKGRRLPPGVDINSLPDHELVELDLESLTDDQLAEAIREAKARMEAAGIPLE